MSAPVLKDLLGNDFTEGDRIVYAAANGIRVGRVDWIKETPTASGSMWYRVYIDLSDHHNLKGVAQMRAKRVGYEYRTDRYHNTSHYFLKV